MSYPKVEANNFYNGINKKFKRFTIPEKKRTFNQICFPKKYELQIPQRFLGEYINPKTPYKGVLVFHRIGAGKTCTAVNIGEQWKEKRQIIVVVPASLIGNFRNELRSPCAGNSYLTEKEREKLNRHHPSSEEYKNIIKESDARIDKFYKIFSYNRFIESAEHRRINLNRSVLIIDEVQNMVSEDGKYYRVLLKTIKRSPKDLRIVLLSATPMFDKPVEIALTMNLLKLPVELPTGREFDALFLKRNKSTGKIDVQNIDIFKERIKGYVSYFRGAPPYVFPEEKIRYVKCEMSDFQYKSYLSVLQHEERTLSRMRGFKEGGILDLPNNFFIGTRMISNVAFPNKDSNESGFESWKGTILKLDKIKKYSTKFYEILKKIKSSTGPVFVYSNFKEFGGLRSFIKVLETNGYKNYSDAGEGRKRFAVWSSDVKVDKREEIKAVFNKLSNINGSRIKIILGSSAIKEGVSLLNVRQIHLLEPYWNRSRILQVIGRGVRYCSHKALEKEKRNVRIYIYLATHPEERQTIDQYIARMAAKKNRLIQEFEKALKESAVDCELFYNGNVFKNDSPLECEI